VALAAPGLFAPSWAVPDHAAEDLPPLPPRIVLYDGVCGLCHRAVVWLVARDRDRRLWFAPLQGETAARLRERHPGIPAGLDSVVLVEEGRVYLRSRAFLRAAGHLRAPWRWARWLAGIPGAFLDPAYRLVAGVRYRVWGRFDACRAPAVGDRSRLLP
jgi:predicted DCC family thiol-disulfide oxidoreductase YuxK